MIDRLFSLRVVDGIDSFGDDHHKRSADQEPHSESRDEPDLVGGELEGQWQTTGQEGAIYSLER